MKRPKRKMDWDGLKVKTLVDLHTNRMKVPAGTVCTVTRNYAGLSLEVAACSKCGVSIYIKKVRERDVVIIDQEG